MGNFMLAGLSPTFLSSLPSERERERERERDSR